MSGRAPPAICLLSGIALSFAFPEPSVAPLAWVAIAPLLAFAARTTGGRGFALAGAFGIGFFGTLLIWISAVGWIAWGLLVVLQTLLFALFGLTWAIASRLPRWWWPVVAPALWVAVEVVRERVPVVGFPWGHLAQGQVSAPWMLFAARVGGGHTIAFLVVALNVLLVLAWQARGRGRVAVVGAAVALLAAPGIIALMEPRTDVAYEPLRVAIVQGNARAGVHVLDERARVERHLDLTRSLPDDVDLVVWPESSVGIDPFRDADVHAMVTEAAVSAGAPMIVGANLDVDRDRYTVMALLVSPEGEIVDRYQKTHLVPFGEYVPARPTLGWIPMLEQIPRDAVAGNEPKNFEVGEHEIATVISFEGDFGPLVRERVALGARMVVVATNTSTWGWWWASAQHVAMSQVRAAETGAPVVHAALSGISAMISNHGRVLAETDLYEKDVLVADVLPSSGPTFYVQTGEWLPWTSVVVSIVAVGLGARRRRDEAVTVPG